MCLVTQSCLTLCDPMDCSPSGSSVHGDSPGMEKTQGIQTQVSCIAGRFFHLSDQGSSLIAIIIPMFQGTKLSHREGKYLCQGHSTSKWPSQDLSSVPVPCFWIPHHNPLACWKKYLPHNSAETTKLAFCTCDSGCPAWILETSPGAPPVLASSSLQTLLLPTEPPSSPRNLQLRGKGALVSPSSLPGVLISSTFSKAIQRDLAGSKLQHLK